jgi:hypothetical protein
MRRLIIDSLKRHMKSVQYHMQYISSDVVFYVYFQCHLQKYVYFRVLIYSQIQLPITRDLNNVRPGGNLSF